MYCGICVEVCPFDALFWTPEFEYSEHRIVRPAPRQGEARRVDGDRSRARAARARCRGQGEEVVIAQNVTFWILAVAMVLAAIGVVRSQNVVHAALYLVVVLAGAAAQYILLAAEFVAWVQVLIYIGAVVILFLFGIMLTRAPMRGDTEFDNDQRWPAGVVASFPCGVLSAFLVDAFGTNEIGISGAKGEELLAVGKAGDPGRLDLPRATSSRSRSSRCCCSRRWSAPSCWRGGTDRCLNQFLILARSCSASACTACLSRRNARARADERRADAQRGEPQPDRVLRLPARKRRARSSHCSSSRSRRPRSASVWPSCCSSTATCVAPTSTASSS